MTLTPQEKTFLLSAIDAAFQSGVVRGSLDDVARMCAVAMSVREKLAQPDNGAMPPDPVTMEARAAFERAVPRQP